jgi:hypothetical protein
LVLPSLRHRPLLAVLAPVVSTQHRHPERSRLSGEAKDLVLIHPRAQAKLQYLEAQDFSADAYEAVFETLKHSNLETLSAQKRGTRSQQVPQDA